MKHESCVPGGDAAFRMRGGKAVQKVMKDDAIFVNMDENCQMMDKWHRNTPRR